MPKFGSVNRWTCIARNRLVNAKAGPFILRFIVKPHI